MKDQALSKGFVWRKSVLDMLNLTYPKDVNEEMFESQLDKQDRTSKRKTGSNSVYNIACNIQ